ncbi:MAG: alpha/beta hydrolase [Candidatus Fimenecus sp.]
MKPIVKRILAMLLIFALTVPICTEVVDICDRQAALTAITQQTVYPDGFVESEFAGRTDALKMLVEKSGLSSDADFADKVKSAFTELYQLASDVLSGRVSWSDASCATRVQAVFDLLLELDNQVQAQKEVPDLTAEDGFVAFGASILWDFMDFYDTKRLSTQEMCEGVSVIKDIPYTENADEYQLLDIYYPAGEIEKCPVIIDIHGGGLMYGDKDMNRIYASRLAEKGYIVIVVDYHLCPEVLYDTQVRDLMTAYKWVAEHGEAYNCDLQNVYLVGDSAGGQLAFYTSIVNTSEELRALYRAPQTGLTFNATGLISGMYDMKSGINSILISCMLGYAYTESPYYDVLQPEEVIDKGTLPPSYIVTSAKDFLRPASVQLDELLTEKGIEHQFHDWELTLNRSSGHITSVAYPDLEESQITIEEMLAFFEAHRR